MCNHFSFKHSISVRSSISKWLLLILFSFFFIAVLVVRSVVRVLPTNSRNVLHLVLHGNTLGKNKKMRRETPFLSTLRSRFSKLEASYYTFISFYFSVTLILAFVLIFNLTELNLLHKLLQQPLLATSLELTNCTNTTFHH